MNNKNVTKNAHMSPSRWLDKLMDESLSCDLAGDCGATERD
jgi:hypothetical protein